LLPSIRACLWPEALFSPSPANGRALTAESDPTLGRGGGAT